VHYHEEKRLLFDDNVLISHNYHNEFSKLNWSHSGRMSALGKEIASMTTSLPPGIFLKVAESRFDVMKLLIVGAEGSPYAGRLFM
jgi:baculoviral IAP repeat-containing protein 6